MKAFSLKYLFIQYLIICLGAIPVYWIYISLSYFFFWRQWDLDYISWLELITIIVFMFSVASLILIDFMFNVLWKRILQNIELYLLIVISTTISSIFTFFFEWSFLPLYFVFNISVFWLYLIYLKSKS